MAEEEYSDRFEVYVNGRVTLCVTSEPGVREIQSSRLMVDSVLLVVIWGILGNGTGTGSLTKMNRHDTRALTREPTHRGLWNPTNDLTLRKKNGP